MTMISDEIRELIDDEDLYPRQIAGLRRIADRIDAEMVELPKDRDGKPIHISDVVWDVDNGIKLLVVAITLFANGVTKVDASCEGCHVHTSPSELTHTRPDSLERIADELDEWCDGADADTNTFDVPRELADRIRKLAKKEDRQCQ